MDDVIVDQKETDQNEKVADDKDEAKGFKTSQMRHLARHAMNRDAASSPYRHVQVTKDAFVTSKELVEILIKRVLFQSMLVAHDNHKNKITSRDVEYVMNQNKL